MTMEIEVIETLTYKDSFLIPSIVVPKNTVFEGKHQTEVIYMNNGLLAGLTDQI